MSRYEIRYAFFNCLAALFYWSCYKHWYFWNRAEVNLAFEFLLIVNEVCCNARRCHRREVGPSNCSWVDLLYSPALYLDEFGGAYYSRFHRALFIILRTVRKFYSFGNNFRIVCCFLHIFLSFVLKSAAKVIHLFLPCKFFGKKFPILTFR